jgi:drug/metabolite transporter (DMT)-like permease
MFSLGISPGLWSRDGGSHFPALPDNPVPKLPIDVVLLVLLGACLHATWNALVKSGSDKQLDSTMVALGASVGSIAALPFVPMPAAAAWPFILASVALHFTYYRLVGAAYKHGDIGLVYPLMRGAAPLIVAISTTAFLGEHLTPFMYLGIATISGGVLALAFEARGGGDTRRAVGIALLNALVISSYTYVDGIGARAAGNPIAYTLWICILPPLPLFAYAFATRGTGTVVRHVRSSWKRGLFGGIGSVVSYGLALYAMTKAPIAAVAALRETSILFALLISVLILKERASPWRYVAGAVIAAGGLAMKLG